LRYPAERHEELEMNLVLDGSGEVAVGSESFPLRRGALVWILPGSSHALTRASADFAMYVASFGPELVHALRACDRSLGEGRGGEGVCLDEDDLQRLSLRCLRLLQRRTHVAAFNAELAALLLDLWHAPTRGRLDEEPLHPAVGRAAALLANGADRWSLPALSRRVGLSPFQLSRAFHARMGVTLAHYGNHQRVQRFERLYGDGRAATLLRAALEAGFGSYSQFFRTYRAVTGWTPDAHRERVVTRVAPTERWDDPLAPSLRA
jgi:AraC-like DNA-binding protein